MQIARNGFKGYKYLKIWIKIALILCIVLFMSHAFYINLTKYISGPRTFYDFFSLLFFLLLAGGVCFTVLKYEEIYKAFQISKKKQGTWYALFGAFSLALLYDPLYPAENKVIHFKRVIGSGIIADVDVSRRIHHFYYWFLLFTIAFISYYFLAEYYRVKHSSSEERKVIKFLDDLIILADIDRILRGITFFYDRKTESFASCLTTYMLTVFILLGLAYTLFHLEKKLTADQYGQIIVSGISISIPISILLFEKWDSESLLGSIVVICIGLVLLIKFSRTTFYSRYLIAITDSSVTTFSLFFVVTAIYVEAANILKQHGVFLSHPRRYYGYIVVVTISIFVIHAIYRFKKNHRYKKWKGWSYFWIVLGTACLAAAIPFRQIYHTDLFEGANHGILIGELFGYGKLPIVEHYGGHMMTGVYEGILYGILGKDPAGAIFSPYSSLILIVLTILFFYFIKAMWNEDMAILVTLFFPFYEFWRYFGLGLAVCFAAMGYVKKNSTLRAFVLWSAVIWCLLYRLDLGFSFGIASIIAMVSYAITKKEQKVWIQLSATLTGWVLSGVIVWSILCWSKGIDPVVRLTEFLMISLSNQNWAYAEIGDPSKMIFAWSYLFIPFMVIICLIKLFLLQKPEERRDKRIWVLLLILGFSYLVNFSRGLVRHSLAEMATIVVIWTAYIFLAAFFRYVKEDAKIFLLMFTGFLLCEAALTGKEIRVADPISESAGLEAHTLYKMGLYTSLPIAGTMASRLETALMSWRTDWEMEMEYGDGNISERVAIEEDKKNMAAGYHYMLDRLLDEGDTYVDLINKTMLYPLVGRNDPVYVSQSPLQLSGEFTQEQFIEEIKNVPLLVMPVEDDGYGNTILLDNIANVDRYYKVFEYVYQNYIPLLQYSDRCAVWCLQGRYDEMREKAECLLSQPEDIEKDINGRGMYKLITYGYDGPFRTIQEDGTEIYRYVSGIHDHMLGHLPRIWAEQDDKDAIAAPVIERARIEGGQYRFDVRSMDLGQDGNYLKMTVVYNSTIQRDEYEKLPDHTPITLVMRYLQNGVLEEKCRYKFILEEGKHDYLIRISSDYYWYLNQIDTISLESDKEIYVTNIEILEGDE